MKRENPQETTITKSKLENRTQPVSNDMILNDELIRLQSLECAKNTEKVWSMNESEIVEYFRVQHKKLPNSKISSKELVNVGSRIIRLEGKVYIGSIVNRKKDGKGIILYESGRMYEGEFMENEKYGSGCELFENGNLYVGCFSKNKKHGTGSFYWFNLCEPACLKTSGARIQQYHGEWWGGLPDGQGQHQKVNGDFYVGGFKNGLKHGQGKQNFANEDLYEGQYINGLPEGFGQYTYADGSKYKGDFKQGYRNGYGTWVSADKKCEYKGHFMLDQKHGFGLQKLDKQIYKGMFIEDIRCGEGQLYRDSQLLHKGMWENGKFVGDLSPKKDGAKVCSSTKNKTQKVSPAHNTTKATPTKTKKPPSPLKKDFRVRSSKQSFYSPQFPSKEPLCNHSQKLSSVLTGHHRRCAACCRRQAEKLNLTHNISLG